MSRFRHFELQCEDNKSLQGNLNLAGHIEKLKRVAANMHKELTGSRARNSSNQRKDN